MIMRHRPRATRPPGTKWRRSYSQISCPLPKRLRLRKRRRPSPPITLHDGSQILLREADSSFDPTNRAAAIDYLLEHQAKGEVTTGLLCIDETQGDMHETAGTVETPLVDLPYSRLSPGAKALSALQGRFR